MRRFFLSNWLLSYDAGFVRRGLLGALGNLAGGLTHNLLVLHVIAAVLVVIIVVQVQGRLGKLLGDSAPEWWVRYVIAIGPLTGILWQTFGDLLHLPLAIWLAAMPRLRQWSAKWALPATAAMLGLFALIHEGSLLIVGPASVWLLRDRRSRIVLSVWIVACLAGTAIWGPIDEKAAILQPAMTAHWPRRPPSFQTAPGATLLQPTAILLEEERDMFAPRYWPYRVEMFTRAAIVPALASWLLWLFGARRVLPTWGLVTLGAAPLFVVAHDWGRFLAYTWIVSLGVVLADPEPAKRAARVSATLVAGLMLALAPLLPMSLPYFVYGSSRQATLMAVGVVAAAVAIMRLQSFFSSKDKSRNSLSA